MKELIWDESLSVDIQEVDEDHRKLVDLYNILNHSVAEGDAKNYIEAVMEELITCTVWHFRHEERLMLKYDYEGLQEHKLEHQGLIDTAKALQMKLQKEDKLISNKEVEFMERWLVGHILGADMKMASYLGEVM